MKLTEDNFPLSCSLQARVQEHFAAAAGDDSSVMPLDELLDYLRQARDLDLSPYADLLSQTEEMGDPALPSREHTAVLRWVGEAMHQFERRFPLEEPLASQVRRLKPLAAAIALVDADFMQPDAHPLHQLLDTIQDRAVGWQARLGRAGTVLEKQVSTAVEGALAWFDNHDADLAAVCAEFIAAAERDESRAHRMARRAVEAELGKIKTEAARRDAALMINSQLERYPVPPEITGFLKGPWYDSAQLILLKFGKDSEQWQQISATTETLLDSVQSLKDASEERRQHVFAVVTQLPKDMRRWLLSLHHDTDAVNDAMALVEFAHLRILRQQPVNLEWIVPIEVAADKPEGPRPELAKALRAIREGHWFGVESVRRDMLRVQLALKNEQEQRLIFTNLAGLKVLDQSFAEFDQLIGEQRVTALPCGRGFSLCLAIAAGIQTTEDLKSLYASVLGAEAPSVVEEASSADEDSALEPALGRPGEDEDDTGAPPGLEEPAQDTRQPVSTETGYLRDRTLEAEQATNTATGESADDLLSAEEMRELESLIDEPSGLNLTPPGEAVPPEDTAHTTLEQAARALAPEDGSSLPNEETNSEEPAPGNAERQVDAVSPPETAAEKPASEGWLQPPEAALQPASRTLDQQARTARASEDETATPVPDRPVPAPPQGSTTKTAPANQPPSRDGPALDLPMGAWLGFHDGATPLMAKLAVHDPAEDVYIFVNRSGIKMRQLSGAALAALIDQGLVDILQTASSFRREVDEARKRLDD